MIDKSNQNQWRWTLRTAAICNSRCWRGCRAIVVHVGLRVSVHRDQHAAAAHGGSESRCGAAGLRQSAVRHCVRCTFVSRPSVSHHRNTAHHCRLTQHRLQHRSAYRVVFWMGIRRPRHLVRHNGEHRVVILACSVLYTASLKNDSITLTQINQFRQFLAEMLLTKNNAIKWRFVIPPLLTNVSALPGEIWTPEIVSLVMLYTVSRKRHCFGLLYVRHSSTNFYNFCTCTLYLIIRPYCLHGIQHDWKDTIFVVHASPGSAETLVTRGAITNRHLIACSMSNISAKITQIGWCALKL